MKSAARMIIALAALGLAPARAETALPAAATTVSSGEIGPSTTTTPLEAQQTTAATRADHAGPKRRQLVRQISVWGLVAGGLAFALLLSFVGRRPALASWLQLMRTGRWEDDLRDEGFGGFPDGGAASEGW
jgi:hypothetical protein